MELAVTKPETVQSYHTISHFSTVSTPEAVLGAPT
jgi:hypothetical protein